MYDFMETFGLHGFAAAGMAVVAGGLSSRFEIGEPVVVAWLTAFVAYPACLLTWRWVARWRRGA